jgi:phage shock protein A
VKKIGFGVVLTAIGAWVAISAFGWVLGLAHRLIALLVIGGLALAAVTLARKSHRNNDTQESTTMFKAIKRWWKYLAMKLHVAHDELADPKVQLEQAIQEAKDQHKRLTEQAANVIANQKQAQGRLDRAVAEYEKAKASARQALVLADQEARSGNEDKATDFEGAAESFASKLLDLERQIGDFERQLLQATSAAEQAKSAVTQNSTLLTQRLAEKEQLLSQLDQAKMQEAMNKAVAQLTTTIGDDVPTFEDVRKKIDSRLARAESMAELNGMQVSTSTDGRMLEVERAQMSAEARARLSELRTELGLSEPGRLPRRGEVVEHATDVTEG